MGKWDVRPVLVGLLMVFGVPLSLAHQLEETVAQVIFREGQVEIRIFADMDEWLETLSDGELWMMGDIDALLPPDSTPLETSQFLQQVLRNEVRLTVDGQPVRLQLEALPPITGHQHDASIVLSGQLQQLIPGLVSISFPISLGTVHASFVRPQYRLLPAGESATVSIK